MEVIDYAINQLSEPLVLRWLALHIGGALFLLMLMWSASRSR